MEIILQMLYTNRAHWTIMQVLNVSVIYFRKEKPIIIYAVLSSGKNGKQSLKC